MLDLDGLKTVNDTLGHPSGDTYIRAFANALRQTVRASDSAYRIGGDEFAIVLHGERAPGALELIGRLNDTLARIDGAVRVSAGAGIVEAQHARSTEELVCQADIALLAAKRTNQRAVVYDPETSDLTLDARKTHADTATLSNALALAVDAKDPYTRSHSQVVSRLCGLVAEALGLDDEHVAQMRLAGLLHDVGKIGVPDALLAKPGALTDSEQAEMRRHAAVGGEIVAAAGLAEESDWVRHHHERYDGTGFPDGLRGDAIHSNRASSSPVTPTKR